jgi:two-component system chemotaxis response regulator CheB
MTSTAASEKPSSPVQGQLAVIGIGASTGGPPCIRNLLAALRGPEMPPVVIVQHLNPAFLAGFAVWLTGALELRVSLAEDGKTLRPYDVLVAPANCHVEIDATLCVHLRESPPQHGRRPAIDALFASLARALGTRAAGVLLTGQGEDGAQGLREMRTAGALTCVQDERSSLVVDMPRAALRLGAAIHTAPPAQLGALLRAARSGA